MMGEKLSPFGNLNACGGNSEYWIIDRIERCIDRNRNEKEKGNEQPYYRAQL